MRRLIFLSLIGGLGLAALLGLGAWQLQRLAWKEDILATIEERIAGEPGPLPAEPDPETDKYRPVKLEGEILEGELHVLTSAKDRGPGYRVIAPFRTEDGRRILIGRGFVPAQAKSADRTAGPATVTGNLHWPQEVDGFTPAPDLAANIWYARDVEAMARALETEPVLVVLREAPGSEGVLPQPVDTAAIPNDHLQYAITWFSLAFIWAAMTVYFLRRPRAKSEG
ncbi:SURF1 family protein [Roseobacteraceae bacterium NS-SX3]